MVAGKLMRKARLDFRFLSCTMLEGLCSNGGKLTLSAPYLPESTSVAKYSAAPTIQKHHGHFPELATRSILNHITWIYVLVNLWFADR